MALNAVFSKLPIRQVTKIPFPLMNLKISKLPIRQVTLSKSAVGAFAFSKLPIRQVTYNKTKEIPYKNKPLSGIFGFYPFSDGLREAW